MYLSFCRVASVINEALAVLDFESVRSHRFDPMRLSGRVNSVLAGKRTS